MADREVTVVPSSSEDRFCDYCDNTIAFEVHLSVESQGQACRAHVGDLAGNLAKETHSDVTVFTEKV